MGVDVIFMIERLAENLSQLLLASSFKLLAVRTLNFLAASSLKPAARINVLNKFNSTLC